MSMFFISKDEKKQKSRHIYYLDAAADQNAVKRIVYCGDCRFLDYSPDDGDYFRCAVNDEIIESSKSKVPSNCPCKS